uniref:III protein n=1 Tax=Psittacine aviadenovirus B TaxID=2169709 RepID=A0AB38ZPB2_9ADEN
MYGQRTQMPTTMTAPPDLPSAPGVYPGTPATPAAFPAAVNGYPPTQLPDPFGNSTELYMPLQRVLAPTGGRNSIRYRNYAPVQNTTKLFYVDNKLSDVDTFNEGASHSNFRTTVIHNQDLDPETAATETIQLDSRSCWGGELKTAFKTNCPNVSSFFQSDTIRVKLMCARDPPQSAAQSGTYNVPGAQYKWYDLTLPEGNYSLPEIIDLLNEGVVQLYLQEGRQNNVQISDIGVKFDTRNLSLLTDPVTGLVTPGTYVFKGYHPDIILLPGCAVDFTYSRLSLMLGICKREPYAKGFVLEYDDFEGGNVPALLDLTSVDVTDEDEDTIVLSDAKPLYSDSKGVSYNVIGEGTAASPWTTAYRSWFIAYNNPSSLMRQYTLLTVPDLSGGIGAMYTSMPDTFTAPAGFKEDNTTNLAPVVGMNLFPVVNKAVYVTASAYAQKLENACLQAIAAFNRFPENEILKQAPPLNVTTIADNQPAVVQQGTLPLKNTLPGLQRVLLTDDQRRPIPYLQKTIATVQPRVLSSATLQ